MKNTVCILLCACMLFFSCKSAARVNNSSRYYTGKVKITAIKASAYNPSGDNMYLDIYFDFIPDSGDVSSGYIFPAYGDSGVRLFYDHRSSFHRNWVKKWGIKTGNEYRASRIENTEVTGGPPVFFDIELSPQ